MLDSNTLLYHCNLSLSHMYIQTHKTQSSTAASQVIGWITTYSALSRVFSYIFWPSRTIARHIQWFPQAVILHYNTKHPVKAVRLISLLFKLSCWCRLEFNKWNVLKTFTIMYNGVHVLWYSCCICFLLFGQMCNLWMISPLSVFWLPMVCLVRIGK
jgi:hypothetical protein